MEDVLSAQVPDAGIPPCAVAVMDYLKETMIAPILHLM